MVRMRSRVQIPVAAPFKFKADISAFFVACSIDNRAAQQENTNLSALILEWLVRASNKEITHLSGSILEMHLMTIKTREHKMFASILHLLLTLIYINDLEL